jgi:hypothetical protein
MVEGLPNDDFPFHPRMNGTEVRVSSRRGEGGREALARFQHRRFLKLIVGANDCVRDVVNVLGEKLKSAMTTAVLSPSLDSASRPRILVREASATNRKIARVPVFKCLRNGDAPRPNLVVCEGR